MAKPLGCVLLLFGLVDVCQALIAGFWAELYALNVGGVVEKLELLLVPLWLFVLILNRPGIYIPESISRDNACVCFFCTLSRVDFRKWVLPVNVCPSIHLWLIHL